MGRCWMVLLALVFGASQAWAQVITTIAGSGEKGYAGNGDIATAAELYYPTGIAIAKSGEIYFADQYNNRIRKIGTNGIISTFAGSDSAGYSGDGHIALAASFNLPASVAIDDAGTLYIADYGNNCIRQVNKKGLVSTYAGNGKEGYSGDGADASRALLSSPISLATDNNGNLFIADQGNNCIRKISRDGIITTYAGTGVAGYKGDGGPATKAQITLPSGVATDKFGNVFLADPVNSCIRKIDANGIITTVAGKGNPGFAGDGCMANVALLWMPWSIAADKKGNLYIADQNNNRVRKVNPAGVISTYAGTGVAGYSGDWGCAAAAELGFPWGLTLNDKDELFIADWGANCIRKVNNTPCNKSGAPAKGVYTMIPNPSQDLIDIVQTDPEDYTAAVRVLDANGKLVTTASLVFKEGKGRLMTTNFPAGMCVMEITDNKGIVHAYKIMFEF